MNQKIVARYFSLAVLAVLTSWLFLDEWFALYAKKMLGSNFLLQTSTLNIPDNLSMLVYIGIGLLWGRYLILSHQGINNEQSQFCQVAGTAVPLAFFLKWPFKFVFGRTDTRIWIVNQVSDDFHWFNGGGDYDSFPSGHMMVFAAFLAGLWYFYPRYRSIYVGLLLVLASSLVMADYHFLSDVIAGAYIGLATTFLTKVFFEKMWR